ncbi:AIPR family protein [Lacibacter sp. MH-610]|uniref:AIPR family protein n=1 Tax=Lacibacter sp. MH-610 TaxID=3020883 RepID=UPI0038912AD5
MSLSFENIELNKFYVSLMQDIAAIQSTDEEGAISEQIFTQQAVDLLAASGESENIVVRYDEKGLGTQKQHKINAYAISENYETVDLFVTIFNGTEEISKVSGQEIDTATKRISNFFRKAIYAADDEKNKYFRSEYADEIEETSEIFQFAYTLAKSQDIKDNLVRVNAFILTNGSYKGEFPSSTTIAGYNFYYKVFDIESLFNISNKPHLPNDIDFKSYGFSIPCIQSPSITDDYQSYLAIIPGEALAFIYEQYGARLLEQNVRSFLQVGGKKSTNFGIRKTIIESPEMFLAYNNGLTTTADEIIFEENGSSLNIAAVKDFQIVNGGQTTASIYHTFKKDKADISKIFVQMKISLIKNKEKFSDIVSNISAFANTQNKVSVSDLSSNRPYHIEFEKLSRSIFTPLTDSQPIQTKWFYERARGQYKNARLKESLPKSRLKAFDLKNPKNQMFTKEELAKYINAYQEIADGKKIPVGPHYVVRGNQKNYVQFINYNLEKKLNNVYYEDTIAKAILYRASEKVYGVKPNAIGDLRYITVPYTISLLNYLTKNQLDLYKIWKAQDISSSLKQLLHSMMTQVEAFIKDIPGGLYGEWAKKEECWLKVKSHGFDFDLSAIVQDLIDKKNPPKRIIISEDETELQKRQEELEKIKSIPTSVWKKIEDWGRETKALSDMQQNIAWNLALKVRNGSNILPNEISNGISIIEKVIVNSPELLFEIDELLESTEMNNSNHPEITLELIKKMVEWDRVKKRLKPHHFRMMFDIVNGKEQLTSQTKKYCLMNYHFISKYGFKV